MWISRGHDYLQGFEAVEAVEAVEVAEMDQKTKRTQVPNRRQNGRLWLHGNRTKEQKKTTANNHLHEVALEEFFQLPLGCRIREVADVQSAALGSTGMDGILVLVLTSDGGIAKSVGNVLDSVGGNFLHGGGHLDQWILVEMGD